MKKTLTLAAASALLATGCSPEPASKPYTGRFKVDSETVYVALDTPSSIGGACSGWNTVEIRKAGQPSGGVANVVCWKRNGADITLTGRDGKQQTSALAAAWSD